MPNNRLYTWCMDRLEIIANSTTYYAKILLTNSTKFAIMNDGRGILDKWFFLEQYPPLI